MPNSPPALAGLCTSFLFSPASSGSQCLMNRPSLSNFSDWLSGLKMRKYGAESVPVEELHC